MQVASHLSPSLQPPHSPVQKAMEACGTGAIFQKRLHSLDRVSKVKDALGIYIPMSIGLVVAAVGVQNKSFVEALIVFSLFPSLLQGALSVWSMADGWNEKITLYTNSVVENNNLRREWERLAQYPSPVPEDIVNELFRRTQDRESQDLKMKVSPKERRFGLRVALYEFRAACVECKQVPADLKPSSCGICGSF